MNQMKWVLLTSKSISSSGLVVKIFRAKDNILISEIEKYFVMRMKNAYIED